MYRKILVALDTTASDQSMLPHITELARLCGSELLLVHVADGWAARNYEQLNLAESEEMREDRAYLEAAAAQMAKGGLAVQTHLALGDPATEILKLAITEHCNLIAMTTHGHKLIGDLVYGSTIEKVRHDARIPMLIVRAAKHDRP